MNDIQFYLDQINELDSYWKSRAEDIYEKKLSLTNPQLIRINHFRQALKFYLLPALREALKKDPQETEEYMSIMVPFSGSFQFYQLFHHFYGMKKEGENDWNFLERSPWEEEVFTLYDLYKSKQILKVIDALNEEIQNPANPPFPSRFHENQKKEILKGFHNAQLMAFKLSVKRGHRKELFQNLDSSYLTHRSMSERQRKKLLYCHPETSQGSRSRRIFLHLLFRNKLKTKLLKKQETTIHYSLVQFEQLRREYLSFWLQNLGNHPEKRKVYETVYFQHKSLAEWMIEDPTKEAVLLENLYAELFNDMLGEINEKVEPELQSPVDPLSEKFGFLKEASHNLKDFVTKLTTMIPGSSSNTPQSPGILGQLSSEVLSAEPFRSLTEMIPEPEEPLEKDLLIQEQEDLKKLWNDFFHRQEQARRLLPLYHQTLYCLTLEALEEAGHEKGLIATLVPVVKCLIIDSFWQESKFALSRKGFDTRLISTWSVQKLKDEIQKISQQTALVNDEEQTIQSFLLQKRFENFDIVVFTDWGYSNQKILPVHIRIQQIKKIKSSYFFGNRVFSVNALELFEEKDFLHPLYKKIFPYMYPTHADFPDKLKKSLSRLKALKKLYGELQTIKKNIQNQNKSQ